MIATASVSSREPKSCVVNGWSRPALSPINRPVEFGASQAAIPVMNRKAAKVRMSRLRCMPPPFTKAKHPSRPAPARQDVIYLESLDMRAPQKEVAARVP